MTNNSIRDIFEKAYEPNQYHLVVVIHDVEYFAGRDSNNRYSLVINFDGSPIRISSTEQLIFQTQNNKALHQ